MTDAAMYEIPDDFADWTRDRQEAWVEQALIQLARDNGIPTSGIPAD